VLEQQTGAEIGISPYCVPIERWNAAARRQSWLPVVPAGCDAGQSSDVTASPELEALALPSPSSGRIDRELDHSRSAGDRLHVGSYAVSRLFGGVRRLVVVGALAVAVAYLVAVRAARAVATGERDLVATFLLSLVPIALVYVIAHYFSLFVLQGQFAIPLASDPFGRGADVLGTADYQVDLAVLSPNAIWYTQVVALVAGHVAGLVVAHDRAVQLFSSARTAVRTQYAMLALMVAYTVGGMWILAQP
jgi:hypothetical protein